MGRRDEKGKNLGILRSLWVVVAVIVFLVRVNEATAYRGGHRNAYATMMYMGTPRDYEFYVATRVMLQSLARLAVDADLVVIASVDVPLRWVQVWIISVRLVVGPQEGYGGFLRNNGHKIPSSHEAADSLADSIPKTEDGFIDWSQDFFGKPAFLTVSGQLNAETYATALTDVKYVLDNCKEDMDFFNTWIEKGIINRLSDVVEKNFVQLTYTDAIALLLRANKKFEFPVEWGCDLQSEHERYITEEAFGGCPVIVRDYPKEIKAFYMRQNDDGKTVAAMDMLVPRVGELIGGSQREERLEYLEDRLDNLNLNKENYWWYLDLRRYGSGQSSFCHLTLKFLDIMLGKIARLLCLAAGGFPRPC
ncbi:class II aminoacyl-tRNA and biotin synthetases superfamily protein [Actinidia rufa]|uniref:Class II aminoacyl-tRNA and biotin synthetases superfamily protein n=1 Tax=Actinidia rufa TaxID=165716 RepID=A0A7J0FSJ9_9ERIC|nr:class II aminoacyl-tRNA and biotin synthetases superfamily protein [Actinidia rufa]